MRRYLVILRHATLSLVGGLLVSACQLADPAPVERRAQPAVVPPGNERPRALGERSPSKRLNPEGAYLVSLRFVPEGHRLLASGLIGAGLDLLSPDESPRAIAPGYRGPAWFRSGGQSVCLNLGGEGIPKVLSLGQGTLAEAAPRSSACGCSGSLVSSETRGLLLLLLVLTWLVLRRPRPKRDRKPTGNVWGTPSISGDSGHQAQGALASCRADRHGTSRALAKGEPERSSS